MMASRMTTVIDTGKDEQDDSEAHDGVDKAYIASSSPLCLLSSGFKRRE